MQIVWFKRDLRISDHAALAKAKGKVLLLYIIEPELWQQPDLSTRHYLFLKECLNELSSSLSQKNLQLVIKVGNVVEVFSKLNQQSPINEILSHQETWNDWTFQRDKQLKSWCSAHKIKWQEFPQNAVVRGLKDRDLWAGAWQQYMFSETWQIPNITSINIASDPMPSPATLKLKQDSCQFRQVGGHIQAQKVLADFLQVKSKSYSSKMSSPLTAFNSCSRLSVHLAFGCISIREVVQKTTSRIIELKAHSSWRRSLTAFKSRLHWHCHFIQKLESEPSLEFINIHSAYNNLDAIANNDYLLAWQSGNTGYPMIDACMRALIATGWINFRMRAMLISFASHHLGLPWRVTGLYLAKMFTDYEPGIHWSQIQMQSGTTGINSIRIYNPIKQSIDHDPKAIFLRQWLPELKNMPDEYIHTPWVYPEALNGYPKPIIDEKIARKSAAKRLYEVRNSISYKQEAKQVYLKLGSRKRPNKESSQRELPISQD